MYRHNPFEYINSLTHQQSVSQTLHTSTASIFTPLLDYHLSTCSNTNTTYTLIRQSLTALVHVKNAEQFEDTWQFNCSKVF